MGTARAAAIDGIQDRIDRAVESEHEHTLSESDKWEGEELDAEEHCHSREWEWAECLCSRQRPAVPRLLPNLAAADRFEAASRAISCFF